MTRAEATKAACEKRNTMSICLYLLLEKNPEGMMSEDIRYALQISKNCFYKALRDLKLAKVIEVINNRRPAIYKAILLEGRR